MTRFLATAALFLGLSVFQQASAAPITVTNHSFETDVTTSATIFITGWATTGNPGGVWNIGAAPSGVWTVGAPDGNNVAYTPTALSTGAGSIEQTTGHVINSTNEGRIYTLSGSLSSPTGFGTNYTLELFAGANTLAFATGLAPEDNFVDFQFRYSTHDDQTGAGQNIGIRLTAHKAGAGNQMVAFDDIDLDVQAIPEPTTALLIIPAGAAVVGYSRKRRRAKTKVDDSEAKC